MAYAIVAPKTYTLKMNVCCMGCERKIKKLIQKIQGVHKVSIEREEEKVTILGTVEPNTVLMKLKEAGKKAEILLEENQNSQIVKSEHVQGFQDPNMVTQLLQLSKIEDLKHLEVTYTKKIKMTREGGKDELGSENDTFNERIVRLGRPEHRHNGGGGGGASPCCGGHVMNNIPCNYHGTCSGEPPRLCPIHHHFGTYGHGLPKPVPYSYFPQVPSPPVANYEPTAPPPPMGYPFQSSFSGWVP